MVTAGNGLPSQTQQPHNVSVAFCNGGLAAGDWRLYVLLGTLYPEALSYTIHSNEPFPWPGLPQGHAATTWKPWFNLLDESGGGGSGGAFGNEYGGLQRGAGGASLRARWTAQLAMRGPREASCLFALPLLLPAFSSHDDGRQSE